MNDFVSDIRRVCSVRTVNILLNNGIDSRQKLESDETWKLLKLNNFGKKSLYEVECYLGKHEPKTKEVADAIEMLKGYGYRVQKI